MGLYELKTVNNAGHLIPMDQGPAARVLMQDFVKRSLTQLDNVEAMLWVNSKLIIS